MYKDPTDCQIEEKAEAEAGEVEWSVWSMV